MRKIIFLIILGIATAAGFIAADRYFSDSDISTESEFVVPTAMANPYPCTMTLSQAIEKASFAFKVPKSIPSTHSIQDALADEGEVSLYYAAGSMCGDGAKYKTFEDGVIQYSTANAKSSKAEIIAQGEEYFKEYKANAPIPEKVKLFQINGMPAMGWESGMRKSFVIDSDGTVIDEKDIPHPAQIRVVDPNNQVIYILKGNLQLEQMKKIMSDTLS